MVKKLFLAAMIALPLTLASVIAAGQASAPASGGERTKLGKDEITMLMIQVGRMPVAVQDRKMKIIWAYLPESETPRSDFLFCTGFAYLGNYKAQACLGNAFENGKGTEKDLVDAFVWYSIALDNPIDDSAAKRKIQEDGDRIKRELLSGSPAKTEKELSDFIKAQKEFKTECLAEIKNTRF
jgi:hypothetical protein